MNYISVRKAANSMGISTQAVYRLIGRGTLRSQESPTGMLVAQADVNKRRTGSVPAPNMPEKIAKKLCLAWVEDAAGKSITELAPEAAAGLARSFVRERRPKYTNEQVDQYTAAFMARYHEFVL